MTYSKILELRASRSAYVLAGIIFGSLTLLTGLAAINDKSVRGLFILCFGCWVFSYAWLFRFRFRVSDDSFTYRSLFGGTKTCRLTEIDRIKKEMGLREYSDRFKPHWRLVIKTNPEIGRSPIYVNLRVFGRAGVRQIVECLHARFNAIDKSEVVKGL